MFLAHREAIDDTDLPRGNTSLLRVEWSLLSHLCIAIIPGPATRPKGILPTVHTRDPRKPFALRMLSDRRNWPHLAPELELHPTTAFHHRDSNYRAALSGLGALGTDGHSPTLRDACGRTTLFARDCRSAPGHKTSAHPRLQHCSMKEGCLDARALTRKSF